MLDVLDENRVSESKSTLEVLEERLVEETRDGDLAILVLVEEESRGLTGRVDDERVSVEPLEHDGVLVREGIRRERLGLPSETILRRREVLWERELGLELDSCFCEVIRPLLPHRLSVLLVEEAGVGEEGGGEEDVADDGAHLSLKGLASDLPTFLLRRETSEESHGPVDLGLNSFHLALDRLGFADEESVLVLVAGDARLESGDEVDDRRRLVFRLRCLILERLNLVPQGFDLVEDVGESNLSDDPLDERSASLGSSVDGLEVVAWSREVFPSHLVSKMFRHLSGIEGGDGRDEVVASKDSLNRLPALDLVSEDDADRFHRDLDGFRRVGHRSNLGEMLLPDVADGGLSVENGWLRLCEIRHDDGTPLLDLDVLLCESCLDFDGGCLLVLGFLLVRNHSTKLVVRFGVLLLELGPLDGETLPELFDLGDGVSKLVESDVEMTLLLLEFVSLLDEESNVVLDAGEKKRKTSISSKTQRRRIESKRLTSRGNVEE